MRFDFTRSIVGLQEFTNYLRKEYSHENIRFWLAVKDLRHSFQAQIPDKVNEIFKYVSHIILYIIKYFLLVDSRKAKISLNGILVCTIYRRIMIYI